MKVLSDLFYTKEHEWVKVDGDEAYVGITDFAQHALGSIVYVELPEVGASFGAGDAFCVIESVKAASDVYMPVDGEVVDANGAVVDSPELVNEDPYDNWLVRVELKDKAQLDGLLKADEYEAFCKEEE